MLNEIIQNHKEQIIAEITSAIAPIQPLKPFKVIGGNNDIGFPRKTCIERIYLDHTLYEGEVLTIDIHDAVYPNGRSLPLHTCTLDEIESVCSIIDVYLIEQSNGRK